jgi:tRNA-Thr(GGU) m(6)t(6)A37 methyltransferase TsaA
MKDKRPDHRSDRRPGERELGFDPSDEARDASVMFIGRIASAWKTRSECPKNMREARERGMSASVIIDPPFREGLLRIERASHLIVLTWFDRAARNLIVQKPRGAGHVSGTFALRSPVRPNPIGLHVVRLLSVDREAGLLALDAIDALDGTPVIDLKPYFASVDSVPDATTAQD